MGTVTGNETIRLELTLDEVTFIIAGLRDCAEHYPIEDSVHPEDIQADQETIQENLDLALKLEQAYVTQLGGK